tara:strand:+ start:17735 stop:18160 length:426 start_codon:yes stop_codon:yes gene_type:complete
MAKVTRKVLKVLVKECLVEILSEGLSEEVKASPNRIMENKPKKSKSAMISPDVFVERNKMLKNKTSKVLEEVNKLTEDPLMRDILADTAATTLLEQKNGEGPNNSYKPADSTARVAYENKPEDLFDGAQNWAALAFSGAKK